MKELQEQIKTALLRCGTTYVYYYHMPSNDYLKENCIVYNIQNSGNVEFFDAKEAIKTYDLTVNVLSPTTEFSNLKSIYIKNEMFAVGDISTLKSEETTFNADLNVWITAIEFELQVFNN